MYYAMSAVAEGCGCCGLRWRLIHRCTETGLHLRCRFSVLIYASMSRFIAFTIRQASRLERSENMTNLE